MLDRWRHPGPVRRRRPGGGLVGEHSDPVLRYPQLGQQLAGVATWVGARRIHQPPPLTGVAPQPGLPGRDDHEAVPEDRLAHHRQGRGAGHAGADGHVGQPVGDQHGHLIADHYADRHLDGARETPGEGFHQRADHELGDRGCGHHPHLLRGTLGGTHCGMRLSAEHDDLRRGGQQSGSACGQRHARRPPADQLVTEVLPKSCQRLRHGRLADAESVRGRGHRAKAGNEDKRVELGKGHDSPNLRAILAGQRPRKLLSCVMTGGRARAGSGVRRVREGNQC